MTEPLSLSDEQAHNASHLLEQAWLAAVTYRRYLTERGVVRGHLEDLDLFGILREMNHDGHLTEPVHDVMARVLVDDSRLDWLPPGIDAPQGIYDEGTALLTRMGVLREGWDN